MIINKISSVLAFLCALYTVTKNIPSKDWFIVDRTTRLLSAFIMSRLDYCNAVLAGLLASTLAPFQRALNAAARLMVGTVAGDRVGDVMRSLHWLPIAYRIRFNLCLLMHAVNNGTGPAYIADITAPISTLSGHRKLRSAATN